MNTRKAFSQARSELTTIVNHVAFCHDRYVLTRNGKDVAAIVPIDDLEMLETLEDERDIEVAQRVDKDIKKHGTVKWKEIKRDFGL
ncbi:Prevent-host-death family protein [Neochlamydia sp. EPS4]|uniref:type II toxin-antitoxin system Phd/YefM family antitoxin n=1 Tax=Neochlamydia sp. EPS4 TaxID=1478175 RepID=UPI0005835CA9|nr:type II toxin-antitoxin system Phd/YefM family antitoxin [Neochlamydia sp. EPS4]KIC73222.1 Prevent-host-death family protein [Neochlamydia sp. EPS4]